ncbi:hypothetical protein FLLO111716_13775 [Flavobacterium longum]|uniref:hypothetical protein n=1 Tax=Flavobacterium longum TaxID=1299340 RepID=UPI0039E90E36
MKKSIICTLFLLTSLTPGYSCGYSFEGDTRYCFFHAYLNDYPGYSLFNYTTSVFYGSPDDVYSDTAFGYPNVSLWAKYCKGKIPNATIEEAVYALPSTAIKPGAANAMISYLYKIKDYDAVNYLFFAKRAEKYNSRYDDPWERNATATIPERQQWIDEALKRAGQVKSSELKRRYYFLAIRLAHYNDDGALVNRIFDAHVANTKTEDIVYHWSLYFRLLHEPDQTKRYYYGALVFAHAPDKRNRVIGDFDYGVFPDFDALFRLARNKTEIANIYELMTMRKVDRALDQLKLIHANNPNSAALPFLVQREINKVEDWILTPYYSHLSPALDGNHKEDENSEEYANERVVLQRSEEDRLYARQLLDFVRNTKIGTAKDTEMLAVAKAHLAFLTRNYNGCLEQIAVLMKKPSKNPDYLNQLQSIRALALVARQPNGNAIIPNDIKPFLMSDYAKQNRKILFSVGRELEYLGNTTDAALLYALSTDEVMWRSGKNEKLYYGRYYYDYMDYIDAMYSTGQLTALLEAIESNTAQDDFSQWKFTAIKTGYVRLKDLLGMKYIRTNQLDNALASFRKAEAAGATTHLDHNPFYEIPYTPKFITRRDSIELTKSGVTEKLIDYLKRSNDPKNKDRDYYSFLVATCYLNMNYQGNSYQMRRYGWSTNEEPDEMPDEPEYHGNLLAKQYYLQAMDQAKTKKFRMLCLRMATRCEKFKLSYDYNSMRYEKQSQVNYDSLLASNAYYKRLYKKYPKAEELSSCESFARYFEARR